jgi:tRNA G26 N,N-dimethylase Trm1
VCRAAPFDGRIRILEALSATGLRAIRYAREITGVDVVVANDFSADAVGAIRRNVAHNGLTTDLVSPSLRDAWSVLLFLFFSYYRCFYCSVYDTDDTIQAKIVILVAS